MASKGVPLTPDSLLLCLLWPEACRHAKIVVEGWMHFLGFCFALMSFHGIEEKGCNPMSVFSKVWEGLCWPVNSQVWKSWFHLFSVAEPRAGLGITLKCPWSATAVWRSHSSPAPDSECCSPWPPLLSSCSHPLGGPIEPPKWTE